MPTDSSPLPFETSVVDDAVPAGDLSRRSLLKGLGATGFGAAAASIFGGASQLAHAQLPPMDWQVFNQNVQAAMKTFGMVGAAVAVVNSRGIIHSQPFGVRDLVSGAPVTPNTVFRVGSATKSMTALMVASFVDQGVLDWDRLVIQVWPEFRAPTAELTRTMRVRDLMGMGTGLGEQGSVGLHYDFLTPLQLMYALPILEVLNPPNTEWYYNNAVYAAAGYLVPLLRDVAEDDLQSAYTELMQERVFGPAGMQGARIGDDPRPYFSDYATGYAPDLVGGIAAEPWVPIGGIAPAGGTLATLMNMSAYISLQLRLGESAAGARVVSSRNLRECWRPHIRVPVSPIDGDVVRGTYAMGWINYTYTNRMRLVYHTGFWDGFGTYMGFIPATDLGLVILTNASAVISELFHKYVLNLLLENWFGLNRGQNSKVVAAHEEAVKARANLSAKALPVNSPAVAPFLGHYARGFRLSYDTAGALRLNWSTRSVRVLAMPDGSYVAASGFLAGVPIHLTRDRMGAPTMKLEGLETVRWLSGLS